MGIRAHRNGQIGVASPALSFRHLGQSIGHEASEKNIEMAHESNHEAPFQ